MNFTRDHDQVVLTHDLDFGAIVAASNSGKPSVIQIRADDTSPDAIGDNVPNVIEQMQRELQDGALLTVEPSRSRVRILPIGDGEP